MHRVPIHMHSAVETFSPQGQESANGTLPAAVRQRAECHPAIHIPFLLAANSFLLLKHLFHIRSAAGARLQNRFEVEICARPLDEVQNVLVRTCIAASNAFSHAIGLVPGDLVTPNPSFLLERERQTPWKTEQV